MSLDHDAIRARADAATEGPWEHQPYGGQNLSNDGWVLDAHGETVICDVADVDGAFIAHARTDVPALLDENARLRAALDAVTAVCDSAPPAQGLTGMYEGTVLPSQIEKAIAAALGEVAA